MIAPQTLINDDVGGGSGSGTESDADADEAAMQHATDAFVWERGIDRARSHCRFARLRIHFIQIH